MAQLYFTNRPLHKNEMTLLVMALVSHECKILVMGMNNMVEYTLENIVTNSSGQQRIQIRTPFGLLTTSDPRYYFITVELPNDFRFLTKISKACGLLKEVRTTIEPMLSDGTHEVPVQKIILKNGTKFCFYDNEFVCVVQKDKKPENFVEMFQQGQDAIASFAQSGD